MTTWVAIITDSDTTDPVVLATVGATRDEAIAAARAVFVNDVIGNNNEDDANDANDEWEAMANGDSEWRITVITAAIPA